MKVGYFDCPSGASGDMILAALLDSGLSLDSLRDSLRTLSLPPFEFEATRDSRNGIAGTRLVVKAPPETKARHYPEIAGMIDEAELPAVVKERAKAVFRLLGEAEAKVHGVLLEKVHFHEVGAVDSIVDIVGSIAGLHLMGVEAVYSGVPAVGSGTVECAHGTLPVPAPATAEILLGRPVRPSRVEGELLTPTGAALLVGLTDSFGPPPAYRLESIGYGIGSAEREGLPNVLRLQIGETVEGHGTERVVVLETDVDDIPAEILGGLFDRALAAGALDLSLTSIVMKKNRPGHRVTIIARPEDGSRLTEFLMLETGTLGVRVHEVDRHALSREVEERETAFGTVRFKTARLPDGKIRRTPEFDDLASIARRMGIPIRVVWETIWREGVDRE